MTDETETDYIGFVSIIDAVCEVFEVTEDELMCHNRARRLTYPRFAAYYLAWLYTKRSLTSVGMAMGRDHTTILYGRDKGMELKRSDPEFAKMLDDARERAFEIELRKELAAQEELEKVKAELRREIEIESEAQRKLEETRKALSKKGVIRGDKIIFPRLDAVG
jgi:hypothetical protein